MSSKKSHRDVRVNTHIIPATRLTGLAVVAALVPIHNAAMFGDPGWAAASVFAVTVILYGLGSWQLLKTLFRGTNAVHLGVFFLAADVGVLLLAIHLTGGPKSWLFFLLAGRCVDQIVASSRRVMWFNHLVVGSYAVYLGVFASIGGSVDWRLECAKLALLYAFNWYCSLAARTVESLRMRSRKTELAHRSRVELANKVNQAIRNNADHSLAALDLLLRTSLASNQCQLAEASRGFNQDLISLLDRLDSGRATTDAIPQESVSFSPEEVLREVQSQMQSFAEAKGIGLRVEIDRATPASVLGDGSGVRQVLLNLVDNAVKFTRVGFVELRVWPVSGEQLAFQVRDTGDGIPAHVQARLSAHLVRADGSAWQRYGGPQVGLTATRQRVESMGGTLEIEVERGYGSTLRFVLDLPPVSCPAAQPLEFAGRFSNGA